MDCEGGKGQDKLYVVIAYADDMQIFICNRNVFLLRLSQKYGIPMQNIVFYDFELEPPSSMIDIKDIRDGMILNMVDKSQLPSTAVSEETLNVAYERAPVLPFQKAARTSGTSVLRSKEEVHKIRKSSGRFVAAAKEANMAEASVLSPGEERNQGVEVGTKTGVSSTSAASGEAPRFKRVKISIKTGSGEESNLPKIIVQTIRFL